MSSSGAGKRVSGTYLAAVGLALAGALAGPALAQAPRTPVYGPFPSPVFDQPIEINGTFGDLRSNHLHAGLDLGTGGVVGRPVHAPMDGEVKRVRASGVGYGRSIYIETADGRLLVFGHLDGFAEPLASYVEAVQDSSGQYDQDLWPEAGRFRVRAGEVIAWSGRSGTGGPHLHVEVRRGDMAIHPLLAGYAARDTSTPRIERVTLAPLDDSSAVAGLRRPVTLELGMRDSVRLSGWGRLRVIVEALDAETDGTRDIAPWRVRATMGHEWVECRFDSVSWATDMAQADFVYDRGRYTAQGKRSLVLAAPAGFRPRVTRSPLPEVAEGGVVQLDGAHPATTLVLEAEDLAGHLCRRTVLLAAGTRPGPAPAGPKRIVATPEYPTVALVAGAGRWKVPAGALCEPARLEFARAATPKATSELAPVGGAVTAGPATTPLRLPVEIGLVVPQHVTFEHVGLYRADGDEWAFVGDSASLAMREIVASTRRIGRFALFRDTRAPRIELVAPAPHAPDSPYPRWALEARLVEHGSGVDPRESYFLVDGRRAPSEWDDVTSTLRWRPLHMPAAGTHAVTVVATDRSGNAGRKAGTFVLE